MTLNLLVAAMAATPYLAPQLPLPRPAPAERTAFYQPALHQTYDPRAVLGLARKQKA